MAGQRHGVKEKAMTGSTTITRESDTTGEGSVLTIGGEQQPGAAGSYPVHNPARPAEIVGHAPVADRAQLDAAVSAARREGARAGPHLGGDPGCAPVGPERPGPP